MTQDEIIEMVREADLDWHTGWTLDEEQSNRFEVLVKLVDAKATAREQKKWEDQTAVEIHEAVLEEREACAKICDEFCYGSTKVLIEKAIRARGQA